MSIEKVKCSKCEAPILPKTFDECAGLCMPCFMKENDGYRPSELTSLHERGLYSYFLRWQHFQSLCIPATDKDIFNDILMRNVLLIHASISGFLRFGKGGFNSKSALALLRELKCSGDESVSQYVSKLESFLLELVEATVKS